MRLSTKMIWWCFRFCLLAAVLATAQTQRQRIAVLPTLTDSESKLTVRQLETLTDKIRSIASDSLPLSDFNLLKSDFVREQLGDEAFFNDCKDGTCIGTLVAKVQADFGARCEVFTMDKKLWLKFELYGTLRGEREAGIISTFTEEAKNVPAMLALIDRKVSDAFKRIIPQTAIVQVPVSTVPTVHGGNYVAQIVTEPSGASLLLNGMSYQACQRTPCGISLYENKVKISAMLEEHHTIDTILIITMPNQLVTIKLKPKMYVINFTSEPLGASVNFDGGSCVTPCPSRFFKRGNVKASANLDMHEKADTVIFVSDHASVNFKLNPKYGTK